MRATSGKSGAQVLRERLKKPEILVAPVLMIACPPDL